MAVSLSSRPSHKAPTLHSPHGNRREERGERRIWLWCGSGVAPRSRGAIRKHVSMPWLGLGHSSEAWWPVGAFIWLILSPNPEIICLGVSMIPLLRTALFYSPYPLTLSSSSYANPHENRRQLRLALEATSSSSCLEWKLDVVIFLMLFDICNIVI